MAELQTLRQRLAGQPATPTLPANAQSAAELQRSLSTPAFKRVITLGDCCMPKMQIDGYFANRPNPKAITGGGYLFDWCVPANLGLLADAIDAGLTDILTADTPVVPTPWEKDGFAPYSEKYDVRFNHLFDKSEKVKHRAAEAGEGRELLSDAVYAANYAEVESKVDHLKSKLQNTRERTLYVIQGVTPYFGRELSKKEHFTHANVQKLQSALRKMRGNSDFTLVVMDMTADSDIHEDTGIVHVKMPTVDFGQLFQRQDRSVPEYKQLLDRFAFIEE